MYANLERVDALAMSPMSVFDKGIRHKSRLACTTIRDTQTDLLPPNPPSYTACGSIDANEWFIDLLTAQK
jgi:hypothetical protein